MTYSIKKQMWSKYGVVLFFLFALCGAILPERLYTDMDIIHRLHGISWRHVLGTDILGRDIFFRLIRATYNVFCVALPSVAIGGIVGAILGILSAYRRNIFRYCISSIMDILFAFPIVLVALLMVTNMGSSPLVATVSLTIFFVPVFYRVAYLSSRPIWQAEYITAARLNGVRMGKVLVYHLVPNIFPIVIAQASIQFAMAILAEAGLGYLGLSVKSPDPTWGSLLLDAQTIIFIKPFFFLPVGGAIFFTVVCFVSLGDNLGAIHSGARYVR